MEYDYFLCFQNLCSWFLTSTCFERFYLFTLKERGKEGLEREREKHHVVASHAPPTGHLARNPGMCTDWESSTQVNWATPARARLLSFITKPLPLEFCLEGGGRPQDPTCCLLTLLRQILFLHDVLFLVLCWIHLTIALRFCICVETKGAYNFYLFLKLLGLGFLEVFDYHF